MSCHLRGTLMSIYNELLHKIETRAAQVGIIGLGYVGLPLAARAGRVGYPVVGFDVSHDKIARINRGESYIGDVPSAAIGELREQRRLEATADFRRLRACHVLVIFVPTPL